MKKKSIILLVLLGILLFTGFSFGIVSFVMKMLKGDAYEMSLSNLHSSNEITTLIGSPIEPSYFVMGGISTSGDSGSADISYSVTGSINSAKVYVVASKELGLWKIEQQVIQISGSNTRIRLVGENSPNKLNKPDAVNGSSF